MTDIFVSYASEDRERVRPLVARLEAHGWGVWWDRDLIAGSSYDQKIEEAIDSASVIVVVWSAHSTKSEWVRIEAHEGLDREILVPVLIDDVKIPLAFRRKQGARLLNWPESHADEEIQMLFQGLEGLLGAGKEEEQAKSLSIAVLPFSNISDDPDQEYFVDGMTEEVITSLTRVPLLNVIARNTTFGYKNKSFKIEDVAKELGVDFVLEGSARKQGNQVRISVQLTEVKSGSHLWAQTYNRELADIFNLQDDIAQQISAALFKETHAFEFSRAMRTATSDLTAYDEFLKGYHAYQQFVTMPNPKLCVKVREHCERAIALDPDYAEAHALKGTSLWADYNWFISRNEETLNEALELGQKAVRLDAKSALAQNLLACVYSSKGEFELGIKAAEKVISLVPFMAEGYFWKASLLHSSGHDGAALKPMLRATHLNQPCPYYYMDILGDIYRSLGDFSNAIESYRESIAVNPGTVKPYWGLAFSHLSRYSTQQSDSGLDLEEARKMSDKGAAISDSDLWVRLAGCLTRLSSYEYDAALKAITELVDDFPRLADLKAWHANVLTSMGRQDEAVQVLQESIERHTRNPLLLSAYAQALRLSNQQDEALRIQKQALLFDPPYDVAYRANLELIILYCERDELALAEEHKKEILHLSPDFSISVWRQRLTSNDDSLLDKEMSCLVKVGFS